MADTPNTQIIIRHTAGAKANRIDPFALAETPEIRFGREAGSTITFDSPKDDVVSRKHAVLRVKSSDPLAFAIEDLKSSNGTFVNGERISGEVELLPEDTVEFGKGGPKFTFDVQPRPESLQARTRAMSAIDATATRAVATSATTAIVAAAPQTGQIATQPAKVGVGRNTVMMLLSNERKRSGQRWMGIMAAAIAFLLVVGGVVVWQLRQESDAQIARAQTQAAAATQQVNAMAQQAGMSPGEIVNKFGNSTVWLNVEWRLYDKETGRPVYHKALPISGSKELVPVYFRYGDNIHPWLTTEDEKNTNFEVRGSIRGTGFVVNSQGFILTNRHLGASWKESVTPSSYLGTRTQAILFTKNDRKRCADEELIDLKKLNLKKWVPEDDGGFIFRADAIGTRRACPVVPQFAQNLSTKAFYGKNEIMTVRFPHSRLSINADLVRTSTDEDIALLKVNSPEPLVPLALATDDSVKVGEKVMTLGYPSISMRTFMTIENDRTGKSRTEDIPEPTVTDGIVQKIGMATTQEGTRRIESSQGDTIQVSAQAAPGSSGGPVFNAEGKVIGLVTFRMFDTRDTSAAFTYAVRIRHGRNLLAPQQMMIQ